MTTYGITTDYEYSAEHKRQRLGVWSGPFFSVREGEALSLPNGAGFMVTTYNLDKVRVSCPSPRTADNYQEVDLAIGVALNAHHDARGDVSMFASKIDAEIDARERQEAIEALAAIKGAAL